VVDGSTDLFELKLDQLSLLAFTVVSLKCSHGLFVAVVRDEPSGRLGKEPNSRKLDQTGQKLEKRWESPGPGAVDFAGTEGDPGSCNASNEPAVQRKEVSY
jgi:hypothetical protein